MYNLNKIAANVSGSVDKVSIITKTTRLKERLFNLQRLLYANGSHGLLIILQGLDASGKDGTIRHVFSCVNPQGCNVRSFKKPSEEEMRHGFLWRIYPHVPAKGMIQIFNRSHYEDIIVPTIMKTHTNQIIQSRYEYINSFESHLQRNNTLILKFFLHISASKQKQKIEQRKVDPFRKWKYTKEDDEAIKMRDHILPVYEEIFRRCSPQIPWLIVPSDQKWYRNYIIAKTVVETLEALEMQYPK